MSSSTADDDLTSKATVGSSSGSMCNVLHLVTLPRNLATIGKKNALDLGDADNRQSLSDELLAGHDKNSLSLSSESSDQICCGGGTNDFDSESSSSSTRHQVVSSGLEQNHLKAISTMSSSKSLTNVCVRSHRGDAIYEERTNRFSKKESSSTTVNTDSDVFKASNIAHQNVDETPPMILPTIMSHDAQRISKNFLSMNGKESPSPPSPHTAFYQSSCSKFTFDDPLISVLSVSSASSSFTDVHQKSESKITLEDTMLTNGNSSIIITSSSITPQCVSSHQPSEASSLFSDNGSSLLTTMPNLNSSVVDMNSRPSVSDVTAKGSIMTQNEFFHSLETKVNEFYKENSQPKSLLTCSVNDVSATSTPNIIEKTIYHHPSGTCAPSMHHQSPKCTTSSTLSETTFPLLASKNDGYNFASNRITPIHLQPSGNKFSSTSDTGSSSHNSVTKLTPVLKTSSNPLTLQSRSKIVCLSGKEILATSSSATEERDIGPSNNIDGDVHNSKSSIEAPCYVINPLTLSPPTAKSTTFKRMKLSSYRYHFNECVSSKGNEHDIDLEALNIITPAGSWNSVNDSMVSENDKSDLSMSLEHLADAKFCNYREINSSSHLHNGNINFQQLQDSSSIEKNSFNIGRLKNDTTELHEQSEVNHNLSKATNSPTSLLDDGKVVVNDLNVFLNKNTLDFAVRKDSKSIEYAGLSKGLSTVVNAVSNIDSTHNSIDMASKEADVKLQSRDKKASHGLLKRSSMPTEFLSAIVSGFNIDNQQSRSSLTLSETSFDNSSLDRTSTKSNVDSESKQRNRLLTDPLVVNLSSDVKREDVVQGWVIENRQSRSSSMPNENLCRSPHTGSGKLGRHAAHGLRITITGGSSNLSNKKSNRFYSDEDDDDDYDEVNNRKKLSCLETDSSNEYESETGIPKSPTLFISGVSICRTPEPKSPASSAFGRQSRSSSLTVPFVQAPGLTGLTSSANNNSQSLTAALGLSFRRRVQPHSSTDLTDRRTLITSSIPGALYSSCYSPNAFRFIDKPERLVSNSSSHKIDELALKDTSADHTSGLDSSVVNSCLSISSTPPPPQHLTSTFLPASQPNFDNKSTLSPISTSSISLTNCSTVDSAAATAILPGVGVGSGGGGGNGGLVKSSTDGALSSVLHVREGSLGSDDFHEALFLLERCPKVGKVGKGSKRRKRSKREHKQLEQMEASSAL